MQEELVRQAEALLYDAAIQPPAVVGAPSPDTFRQVGRDKPAEMVPKRARIIRFDGCDLPVPKGDRISLVPLCDIHYGALTCNRPKFEAYLEYILKSDDTYCFTVGDLQENATKTSIGRGVYEQEEQPEAQLEYMVEALSPLVAAKKLLGVQPGNHEERTAILTGFDPTRMLAKLLGVPYLGYQGYWLFDLGPEQYRMLSFHGKSAATTRAGRLNAVRRLNQVADADLYVMGHVHDICYEPDYLWVIDERTGEVVRRTRHYVIAGSLLSYFGGYPEMAGYPPGPVGLVRVDLMKDRHEIIVTI